MDAGHENGKPVARTGERILGVACPHRGHQVPRGVGTCQTGRFQWLNDVYDQPLMVKMKTPDGPSGMYVCCRRTDG